MDLIIKTWPDVRINRKKPEEQIFSDYFKQINQNDAKKQMSDMPEVMKDIEISNEARQQGNTKYVDKMYSAAMGYYKLSIAFAPRDSIEYGLSLANRSAVLFDLKRYKECLVDIKRVFFTHYPKNMLYKIFIRRAKCYLELQCYSEAFNAIEKAKRNFESVKDTLDQRKIDDAIKKINDIDDSLKNCSDNDMPIEDEFSVPKLTAGENPLFVDASNTVAFKINKLRGKHVVANVDIKKGDVLFVEKPYSFGMCNYYSEYLTYCSRCFISTLTCIPCTTCTGVLFCSDVCRKQAWDERHHWECAGIRRDAIDLETSLTLGILFGASLTGFNTNIQRRYGYGNRKGNYPYINRLNTHKYSIAPERYNTYVKKAAYLVIYLIHFTDYFDWLYVRHNKLRGSREDFYQFIGGLLLKTLCQIDTNKEIIEDQFVELEDWHSIGLRIMKLTHAIYVSSNLLNHSCLPNAAKSFYGSTKIVRALTDIKSGTEITVSYIQYAQLAHVDIRRQVLKREFYFDCTCEHCLKPNKLFPWLCQKCKGPAYTTSDQMIIQCEQCKHTFPAYKKMQEVANENYELYTVTKDINYLNRSIQIMRQIYYKNNWILTAVYGQFVLHYQLKGEFKNCVEYLELLLNLHNAVHANTAIADYVQLFLKYCLTCVNYYLSVKDQHPHMYDMAKEAILTSMDLLKYYIPRKYILNYKEKIKSILNAGDLNFGQTKILCHPNIIE